MIQWLQYMKALLGDEQNFKRGGHQNISICNGGGYHLGKRSSKNVGGRSDPPSPTETEPVKA